MLLIDLYIFNNQYINVKNVLKYFWAVTYLKTPQSICFVKILIRAGYRFKITMPVPIEYFMIPFFSSVFNKVLYHVTRLPSFS